MGVGAPSGTVTFLFTDIEGSTRLWQQDEAAMRSALARHDSILRSAIDAHEGYVFATGGDGFGVAFTRAGDAIAAAVEAQAALSAEPWPEGSAIRVRMGLHTGVAEERDGDYFGTAVNQAARVMAVAHGGQVVCSAITAGLVSGDATMTLVDLGSHRLRDLSAAQQIIQVGDGRFPALRSMDAIATNLPTQRTELIGRSDDVAELSSLVGREQLVTLTGVGGVGKTRLALAVAATVAPGFSDGCWLVELAPIAEGSEGVNAVAGAIGAPVTGLDNLVTYLADRQMLLVVDNCEHLLGDTADLVDAVLADAPDVHVIVTSREPLGLDGEQVRRVQSLEVPAADAALDDAAAMPAVRLFVARASSANDRFALDESNNDAVVEICRHLDGIPLAIELAAARVRAMPPAEIAARLGERFRLLAGGPRRAQERHRTLLATVAWSHDLLTTDEQVVFRRLAVFPASFDLPAAEAVAGDDGLDVLDHLVRLVDRSLVQFEPDTGRYRLLETLRQFGADRLGDAGETDATRERHARHYLHLVEQVAPELRDARDVAAYAVLTAEMDNLRATADWCVDHHRWADLLDLARNTYLFVLDFAVDGSAWFREAIEHPDDLEAQDVVDALGELAWMAIASLGDFPGAVELAERSHALAAEAGCAQSAWAWGAAGLAGMPELSQHGLRATEVAVSTADARGIPTLSAIARSQLGTFLVSTDPERAAVLFAESVHVAEQAGQRNLIWSTAVGIAVAHVWFTFPPASRAALAVLDAHPDLGRNDRVNDMWANVARAAALASEGRTGGAAVLVAAANVADRLRNPWGSDLTYRLLALAVAEAGHLTEAAMLLGYGNAHLLAYRNDVPSPQSQWIGHRLDTALAALPDRAAHEAAGAALDRRQVLALVDAIGAKVTADEQAAAADNG